MIARCERLEWLWEIGMWWLCEMRWRSRSLWDAQSQWQWLEAMWYSQPHSRRFASPSPSTTLCLLICAILWSRLAYHGNKQQSTIQQQLSRITANTTTTTDTNCNYIISTTTTTISATTKYLHDQEMPPPQTTINRSINILLIVAYCYVLLQIDTCYNNYCYCCCNY